MTFIEVQVFTRDIQSLMSDDEYRDLQRRLIANPTEGVLIPGGGGLRKLRWVSRQKRKGKRGGVRVIYYLGARDRIYMVSAYSKSSKDDMTHGQLKAMRALVKKGLYEGC